MVDALSVAINKRLKAVRIFTEIVKHSAQRAQASSAEFAGASRCQFRYVKKMIGQTLPARPVLILYRMGEIHSSGSFKPIWRIETYRSPPINGQALPKPIRVPHDRASRLS